MASPTDISGMELIVDIVNVFNGMKNWNLSRWVWFRSSGMIPISMIKTFACLGKENVKRAVEVVAEGGHNTILLYAY